MRLDRFFGKKNVRNFDERIGDGYPYTVRGDAAAYAVDIEIIRLRRIGRIRRHHFVFYHRTVAGLALRSVPDVSVRVYIDLVRGHGNAFAG